MKGERPYITPSNKTTEGRKGEVREKHLLPLMKHQKMKI